MAMPKLILTMSLPIMFKPLTKCDIYNIIDLLVTNLNERLTDRSIHIRLTNEAKSLVVDKGYDPMYGARPLKRFIQRNVETRAAKLILEGDIGMGDTIVLDKGDNGEIIAYKEH